jgi:hypothetical protein
VPHASALPMDLQKAGLLPGTSVHVATTLQLEMYFVMKNCAFLEHLGWELLHSRPERDIPHYEAELIP